MKVWVIGRGGLLGRSVELELAKTAQVFKTGRSFDWHDVATVKIQLEESCKQFFGEVKDDKWSIFWCAGRGTLNSSASQMTDENHVFEVFVQAIEANCLSENLKNGGFFYASSAGAVYAGSSKPPFTELSVTKSLSAYGDAKLHQETLLKDLSNRLGVRVLIGRISNLFGARQDLAKNQGLISTICYSVLRRQPINLFVPLETSRNYIYVDDAAKIIVKHSNSMFSNQAPEKVVTKLVVARENLTIGSILKIATAVLRVRPLITISTNKKGSIQPQNLVFKSVINTDLDGDLESTGFTVGVKKVVSDLQSNFLTHGWQKVNS